MSAEAIYKNHNGLSVKSAGTEPSARIKITAKLIDWADIIFVMEKRHKQKIIENFKDSCLGKEIITLDIPDDYAHCTNNKKMLSVILSHQLRNLFDYNCNLYLWSIAYQHRFFPCHLQNRIVAMVCPSLHGK